MSNSHHFNKYWFIICVTLQTTYSTAVKIFSLIICLASHG